jgi:hypothetical protein
MRKDNGYFFRQKIKDEADLFEANLRRNYGWRLSSEEISERRVRYEGERYLCMESIKKNTSD